MLSKDLSPDIVKQHLLQGLPENLKNAFERVTVAGMKLFYSKDIQSQIMAPDDPVSEPMAQQLSVGTVGVMMQLWQKSQSTIPPQVIVPASIFMLVEGADFLDKSGKFKVTDQDVGKAIELAIVGILHKFGIDGAKAQQLAQQLASQTKGGGSINPPSGLLSKGAA